MSNYERLAQIYAEGIPNWDLPLPPPEVLAQVQAMPAGRALDLGCGLGRASIYLAQNGWQVDGLDFVAQAVLTARERAAQAGVANRVHFYHSPVAQLGFLQAGYDFALDVGCGHGLDAQEWQGYHAGLRRLLKPGALYLLFAHLNDESAAPELQRWLAEAPFLKLFADGFDLSRVEYGQTQVAGQPAWRSAWYWFLRNTQ